jgi:hypothetical protein|tara:strand:- start:983 stop:1216 length:234 start_codon:yes stop_codon:yes gene_type:complete
MAKKDSKLEKAEKVVVIDEAKEAEATTLAAEELGLNPAADAAMADATSKLAKDEEIVHRLGMSYLVNKKTGTMKRMI